MIIIHSGNKTYGLSFQHTQHWGDDTRLTECKIFELSPGKKDPILVREGMAICVPEDNFCKFTGRKIALKRALCDHELKNGWCYKCRGIERHNLDSKPAHFTPVTRKDIWLTYLSTVRMPNR